MEHGEVPVELTARKEEGMKMVAVTGASEFHQHPYRYLYRSSEEVERPLTQLPSSSLGGCAKIHGTSSQESSPCSSSCESERGVADRWSVRVDITDWTTPITISVGSEESDDSNSEGT